MKELELGLSGACLGSVGSRLGSYVRVRVRVSVSVSIRVCPLPEGAVYCLPCGTADPHTSPVLLAGLLRLCKAPPGIVPLCVALARLADVPSPDDLRVPHGGAGSTAVGVFSPCNDIVLVTIGFVTIDIVPRNLLLDGVVAILNTCKIIRA